MTYPGLAVGRSRVPTAPVLMNVIWELSHVDSG